MKVEFASSKAPLGSTNAKKMVSAPSKVIFRLSTVPAVEFSFIIDLSPLNTLYKRKKYI